MLPWEKLLPAAVNSVINVWESNIICGRISCADFKTGCEFEEVNVDEVEWEENMDDVLDCRVEI